MGCSRCPFGAGQVQRLICYQYLSKRMLSLPFWSRTGPEVNLLSKLIKKGGVVSVVHSRGICKSLRSVFLPLLIACSFTCSVASLGRYPHHYLPGLHGLRHGALADYQLGQGRSSTCPTGLTAVPDTTSPTSHLGDRRLLPLPVEDIEILSIRKFVATPSP